MPNPVFPALGLQVIRDRGAGGGARGPWSVQARVAWGLWPWGTS